MLKDICKKIKLNYGDICMGKKCKKYIPEDAKIMVPFGGGGSDEFRFAGVREHMESVWDTDGGYEGVHLKIH